MPWSSALSWFSLPSLATNLAITCTLATVVQPVHSYLLYSGGTRCHVPSILRVGSTLSLIQEELLLKMSRILGQNQFAGWRHASLEEMATVGDTVGPSHYHVRIHLRLSVFEGDVANQRKQFHLFVENAGWIVLFRFPVEPTQLRVRKHADGVRATSPNGVSRTVAARLRPRRSRTLRQEPSVPSGFVSTAARQGTFTFSEA